jgi:hypothetical protein
MEERKSHRRSTLASMKPVERARMSFMVMRVGGDKDGGLWSVFGSGLGAYGKAER